MLTTSLEIGLVIALACLTIGLYTLPRPRPAGRPPQDYTPTMWMPRGPHDAPEVPLTLEQAHKTMQTHLECRLGKCPHKDAAWEILIVAGDEDGFHLLKRIGPFHARIKGTTPTTCAWTIFDINGRIIREASDSDVDRAKKLATQWMQEKTNV